MRASTVTVLLCFQIALSLFGIHTLHKRISREICMGCSDLLQQTQNHVAML